MPVSRCSIRRTSRSRRAGEVSSSSRCRSSRGSRQSAASRYDSAPSSPSRRRVRTSPRGARRRRSTAGGPRGRRVQDRHDLGSAASGTGVSGSHSTSAHQVRRGRRVDVQQPEPLHARVTMSNRPSGSGRASRRSAEQPIVLQRVDVVGPDLPALVDAHDAERAAEQGAGHQVDDQLPVPRLEDVQRQRRAGQQHGAQREERERLGHASTLRATAPRPPDGPIPVAAARRTGR